MKHIAIFLIGIFSFVRTTHCQELKRIAEDALRNNPAPIDYKFKMGYATAEMRKGYTQWYGTSQDDPWVHPYVNVFKGAKGGFDIFMTVDPAEQNPGSNEIDAHIGSYRDDKEFSEGDKPGDLFILGDFQRPYYAGKSESGAPERDFVYIFRFEIPGGIIRLYGEAAFYNTVQVTNPETNTASTALFYTKNGYPDLIAIIDGIKPEQLDLNGLHFEYDKSPGSRPHEAGITQLGNGGIQVFGEIAMDEEGNLYQTFLSSGPDFSEAQGKGSFYLVKWNSQGVQQWIRKYGVPVDPENGSEMPYTITANNKYVFVSGNTKGSYGGPPPLLEDNYASIAILVKIDAITGEELKVVRLTQREENGNGWAIGQSSDQKYVYVGGGDSGNGKRLPHTSPFIKVFDQESMKEIWSDIIIDGTAFHRSGPLYWQISNEVFTNIESNEENIWLGGYNAGGGFFGGKRGLTNVWVAQYDMKGKRKWGTSFGAEKGDQYPYALAIDDQGNAYIVGQTHGSIGGQAFKGNGDGFIQKIDKDGNKVWSRLLGTPDSDEIQDIRIDGDAIYLLGTTHGKLGKENFGMMDCFVAKMDLSGNWLHTYQFGSDKIDHGRTLLVTDRHVLVSGITEGNLGGDYSGSGFDVFVVKLDKIQFN